MRIGSSTIRVYGCRACQVDHIVLRRCNAQVQPQIFSMEPTSFIFNAKFPMPAILGVQLSGTAPLRLKAIQLPLVSNTATTGHKLQGSTVSELFVHAWNYSCRNWIYVVLSRVRTMSGLIFRRPLQFRPAAFQAPRSYQTWVDSLQDKRPTFYTDEMDETDCDCHFGNPFRFTLHP